MRALADQKLPDAWIAAGAIRNAVWDHLHGYAHATPLNDVDVIWYDPAQANCSRDRVLEAALARRLPGVAWSVKNQARMHIRNGDLPYTNCADAMRYWPETATAVAARLAGGGDIELCAPFGLGDLVLLVVRATPYFAQHRREAARHRWQRKNWTGTWPNLKIQL